MRIGVNALRLSGQRFGIGRYTEYMFRHWDKILRPDDEVIVYVRDPFDKDSLGLSDAFKVRLLRPKLTAVLWEHLVLANHHRDVDVLFCPAYTMPLHYRGRCVVATHSVNEVEPGAHPWWYYLTYTQRYRLSARRADAVIVPCESAKRHVIEYYGVLESKIDIVAEGVDESFQPMTDQAVLRATRRKYLGADVPYILFVGKMSQRRSTPALLAAFAELKKRDKIPHKLLLFGPNIMNLPLEKMVSDFGIQDSVVQTDGVVQSHRELIPIYSGADLFVHPSRYEGFSLTICEAMACGVPVITINRGAAKEITEGVALLVDEPSPEHLAPAMRRVLQDPALRQSLSESGRERVRRFRFSEMARGTLDVLRKVADDGRRSAAAAAAPSREGSLC